MLIQFNEKMLGRFADKALAEEAIQRFTAAGWPVVYYNGQEPPRWEFGHVNELCNFERLYMQVGEELRGELFTWRVKFVTEEGIPAEEQAMVKNYFELETLKNV